MSETEEKEGISRLARTLQGRMYEVGHSPPPLDYGTIQGDMSLATNYYPAPIPRSNYMVCRQLTIGDTGGELTKTADKEGNHTHEKNGRHGGHLGDGDGEHTHEKGGEHGHTALIPEKMRRLRPGDRVLVAWVDDEACVIDLLLPATAI